jgi:hypothetical protein
MPGVADGAGLAEVGAGAAGAAVDGLAGAAAIGAAGAGAVGAGPAGASATGVAGAAAGLAAAFAGALAGASSAGLAFGNASRSFLATGGAMVEEPLLTNSPSSASLAKATLESIPSSLAMS